MYLHLGNDFIVNEKYIIGIFDLEKSSVSKFTRDFLAEATRNKRVVNCTEEMPKSFVVTLDEELTERVYISQLSCATLKKRAGKMIMDS
ncbi:protein of unknown function [Ruminococcaceae bacterium FB2012]|nr:protein of unknown function [Ruminococcaceae bacterium FB2012]